MEHWGLKATRVREDLLADGLLAILRGFDRDGVATFVEALLPAGIRFIEITMEAAAFDTLRWLSQTYGDRVRAGAGTILTVDQAHMAADAGAEYLVSPGLFLDVAKAAHATNVLYLPGVTTPTEVGLALRAGLDLVKLFPAGLLGPDYLRALRGPYPQLKAIAVGNMSFDRMEPMLRAGAVGIALGGSVFGRGESRIPPRAQIEEAGRHARALIQTVRSPQGV